MELDISKEITCKWQNQNVLSNYAYMYKHNIKCYKMLKWQKWTLKNYLCIRTQKVCPSMPSFVSAVLFIPSFNVLSCYFYDSLNLVAVPTAWILINFVTLLLYNVTLLTFTTNNSPQLNSLVALTVYIPYFELYRGNCFKENASQLLCLKSHIKSITLWMTKKLI